MIIKRKLLDTISKRLKHSRIVLIEGARQAGKTTLLKQIQKEKGGKFVSLEDIDDRRLVLDDPKSFVNAVGENDFMVIDEFQLGGDDLMSCLHINVDDIQTPGRFLVSGSTNFTLVPTLSKSLAGRINISKLYPLSESERHGTDGILKTLFKDTEELREVKCDPLIRNDYVKILLKGGYPEILGLTDEERKSTFASYLQTIIQRDISVHGNIRKPGAFRQILKSLASLQKGVTDITKIAKAAKVDNSTANDYIGWLDVVFLISEFPKFEISEEKFRITEKRRKIYIADSGLAAHVLGVSNTEDALTAKYNDNIGNLLEGFVVSELKKQISWSEESIEKGFWQQARKNRSIEYEVDIVLINGRGELVAIEVKAGNSLNPEPINNLKNFRDRVDQMKDIEFVNGVLLCTTDKPRSHGDRITSMPISSLWA